MTSFNGLIDLPEDPEDMVAYGSPPPFEMEDDIAEAEAEAKAELDQ